VRASDDNRERTVSLLGERYAQGYLSTDTLARRVEAAYGATTQDELDALERDLPPRRSVWRRALALFDRREPAVTIELPRGPTALYVGRSSGCDAVVRDPTVSRVHARIDVLDAGWRIRDLGSTNGTRVNGRRVTEAALGPRDELELGTVRARLR
jgi:hypothetical protein